MITTHLTEDTLEKLGSSSEDFDISKFFIPRDPLLYENTETININEGQSAISNFMQQDYLLKNQSYPISLNGAQILSKSRSFTGEISFTLENDPIYWSGYLSETIKKCLANIIEFKIQFELLNDFTMDPVFKDNPETNSNLRICVKTLHEVSNRLSTNILMNILAINKPKQINTQLVEEKVLESFKGKVTHVEGNIGYLELMNSACQRFFTKYKVEELKSKGISVSEGTLFTYKVKKRGDEIISTFEQIPRKHLTKDQWDQLYQEISEIHDNYDISDDY